MIYYCLTVKQKKTYESKKTTFFKVNSLANLLPAPINILLSLNISKSFIILT